MCDIDYEKMSEQEAKDYFNKNYNISYVDENLPTPSNELLFKHYVSSAFVYAVALMIFLFNPFYVDLFNGHPYIKESTVWLFFAYLIIAPICLWIFKPKTVYASHSVEVINYLLKLVKREGLKKDANSVEFIQWLKPTYKQQQSLILYFIKCYFGPQLLVWSFTHFGNVYGNIMRVVNLNDIALKTYTVEQIMNIPNLVLKYRTLVFMAGLSFLYFIDTVIFAFGYLTELTFLKNRIRTVESTALGLFFCLCCYPTFSSVTVGIIPWDHNEGNFNGLCADPLSWPVWVMMGIAFISVALYASASVALLTRASNLTNRGTVTCFPYSVVRHPAYSAKILMWLIGSIVAIKVFIQNAQWTGLIFYILGVTTWTFIYYMRAITEERHLYKDPDYRAYCKKVKYKFIPKVW